MPNGGWNQTHAWDEWYDHVEHVQRVQKGFIDDLNVEVVKLRHELRLLTAHVSLFTNNTVPNPISLSSAIPAPSSSPPWPLPNSPTTPDRECQHGMIEKFSENFTPAMFPDFHALHDGNDICWAMLQSAATKNDMQHSLLETSFRGCQDLRIERYGKKIKPFDLLAHAAPVAQRKLKHERWMVMEAVCIQKLMQRKNGFGGGFSRRY